MDMVEVRSELFDLEVIPLFDLSADFVERTLDLCSQERFAVLHWKYDVVVGGVDAVAASFEHADIVPYPRSTMQEPKVPALSEAVPRGCEYARHGVYINYDDVRRKSDRAGAHLSAPKRRGKEQPRASGAGVQEIDGR